MKKKPSKAKQKARSLHEVDRPPRRDRAKELALALAKISKELVDIGLGQILLGRLARHMLKLRRPIDPKLSDGGARRGSCVVERSEGIRITKKGGSE